MTKPITRRHALMLSGGAFVTSCVDSNRPFGPEQPTPIVPPPPGWSSGVPLPYAVQEIYPCALSGELQLAGGFIAENGRITGPTARNISWHPTQEQWTENIHGDLPTARHHPHIVAFNDTLYALGGFESPPGEIGWIMQSSVWDCDFLVPIAGASAGYWSWGAIQRNNLPVPCAEAVTGVTGDGALHLAGGRTPKGVANAQWSDHIDTDHHFVFPHQNGQWETAAPCLTKRNSAAGDVINGNLHVVGGRTVGSGNVATHEVYDHKEDRWRTAAPMPQAQGGLAAAAVGGKLYAFGGEYFDNGGGVYKEAWVYDPVMDAWSALPDMPNPRHGLGAVALNGSIYVIGGALQASGVDTSNIVDIYTPA